MITPVALVLLLMQELPTEGPRREMSLAVSCKVTTNSTLTDPRTGQQPTTLLKSDWEFTLRRHLAITGDALTVRYDEFSCHSPGQDAACPRGLAIDGHTFSAKLPPPGASIQPADISWPADWSDQERNFALSDLPLVLGIALADSQSIDAALSEGLLLSVPGAGLTANAGATEVRGEFKGTGVPISLIGKVSRLQGEVTLKAEGISAKETTGMGQVREDQAAIVCTRSVVLDK